MCGIKIPQQDFELKMPGGGAYARGGAYLRDTTVLYIIYLSAVRTSFRKCRLSSFNPKHCTRRSVRAKNLKQCSTLEPFHFSYTD